MGVNNDSLCRNCSIPCQMKNRSILLGSAVGILGAGGQLLLFQALRDGPAYIIFPFDIPFSCTHHPSLSISIEGKNEFVKMDRDYNSYRGYFISFLSRTRSIRRARICLACALNNGFIAWGLQAFAMKFSNETMKAESIFFI